MGVPGVGPGQKGGPDLRVSAQDLTKLADDLDDMQDHLDQQVRRMDAIVDSIEAGWQGPAASVYRDFHRAATEDAVRIREVGDEGSVGDGLGAGSREHDVVPARIEALKAGARTVRHYCRRRQRVDVVLVVLGDIEVERPRCTVDEP